MNGRVTESREIRPRLAAVAAAVLIAIGAGAGHGALAAGERASGAEDRPGSMLQEEERAGQAEARAPLPSSGQVFKASELIGQAVTNREGERLGEIENLAIDWGNGRVPYAVLSFGGVLGIGDKHLAVPISAFSRSVTGDTLVLDVTKEKLETMEGFDEKEWPPELASHEWGDAAHARSGAEPVREEDTSDVSARAEVRGSESRAAGGSGTTSGAMTDSAAGQAPADPQVAERFARYDADGDRHLTRDEVLDDDRLVDRFAGLDQNNDGRLTEVEFARFTIVSPGGPSEQPSSPGAREPEPRAQGGDRSPTGGEEQSREAPQKEREAPQKERY